MLKTTLTHSHAYPKHQAPTRRCTYVIGRIETLPSGAGVRLAAEAENDRRLLPRRHPGVESVRPPTDASYGTLPAWRSRSHWLAIVVPMSLNTRPQILARHHVARDTFRTWARHESLHANITSGRQLIVRPDTIALTMECATRTVQRCRAAARELGLLVDVQAGRMLTLAESMQARYQGSPQRGFANESALTVPAWLGIKPWQHNQFGDHVTPTSGTPTQTEYLHNSSLPRRANGTPRLAARLNKKTHRPPIVVLNARKAAHRLARQLIDQIGFLYGEQPARLVPTLTRFASGNPSWTAHDIYTHITRSDSLRGRTPLRREHVTTRPAAVLAAYLRDADPQADHPRFDPTTGFTDAPRSTGWPTWCGHCDEHTRQIELDNGHMARCQTCHPKMMIGF